jgi:YbbR domain-containing protein
MKIELAQGDTVTITLKDSDGEITVSFGTSEFAIFADLQDTAGRVGEIYSEKF